jgi:hypothetical protein
MTKRIDESRRSEKGRAGDKEWVAAGLQAFRV